MDTERMYFEINRNGHQTVYGPFASKQEARIAAYWARSLEQRDARRLGKMHTVFSYSIYSDAEIASCQAAPSDVGFKSFKVVAKAPMHKSWKALRDEYGQASINEIMTEDYERAFGSKPE